MKTQKFSVWWTALFALVNFACAGTPAQRTLSSEEKTALDRRAQGHQLNTSSAGRGDEARIVQSGASADSVGPVRPQVVEGALPNAPADTFWSDGWGLTQHEAVLNAKRVISEQIVSQVTSETRSFEADDNGVSDSHISVRIKATSSFEHGELIFPIGVKRENGGFTVRAVLHRNEAAAVYRSEIDAHLKQLEESAPVLRRAIATGNSAILLSTKWSPSYLLNEVSRKRQIIRILGQKTERPLSPDLAALVKETTNARAKALIRLEVSGDVSPSLKAAVVGEVSSLLSERGCQFASQKASGGEGSLLVDAKLEIVKRDHIEQGILWRYLGLELSLTDARNETPVFAYAGLPEIVHGGGASWPQADQAVVRRLREKLSEKAGKKFLELTCR